MNICICVRKRPLFDKEYAMGEIDCVSCSNPNIIVHEPKIKVDGITKYVQDTNRCCVKRHRLPMMKLLGADSHVTTALFVPFMPSTWQRGMVGMETHCDTSSKLQCENIKKKHFANGLAPSKETKYLSKQTVETGSLSFRLLLEKKTKLTAYDLVKTKFLV